MIEMRMDGRCALITGGSMGIGYAAATNFMQAGARGSGPSSVTLAAGLALTKVLSNEGAPHNVLVNAVLVGLIQTDQWVRGHAEENKGRTYDEYIAEMAKRIPVGRVGTAEEFANMILFLASDAGSFVTGTAINVDGGMIPVV
jgi:NAD(P)-dependent dehydrogenase (short-subunit alcohol dehydrogenase family)